MDDAREADVRVGQGVVDRRARRPRPTRGATRRATSTGMSTSVSSGACGPCCSVDPTGTITVSWSREEGLDLEGGHLAQEHGCGLHRRPPLSPSGDGGGQLPDALDPGRHDVAGLRGAGPGPAAPASRARRAGRDQVARPQDDVAAEVGDDLGDRRTASGRCGPSWIGDAVDGAAEPEARPGRSRRRVTTHGPTGQKPGHGLAEQPLVAVQPRVARRDVVDAPCSRRRGSMASPGTDGHAVSPMTTPSSHSASTFAVRDRSQVDHGAVPGRPTSAPCRRPAAGPGRARRRASPGRGR